MSIVKFNATIAKRIIEENNLNKNLINVWKQRGSIPSKYFDDDTDPNGFVSTESLHALFQNKILVLKYIAPVVSYNTKANIKNGRCNRIKRSHYNSIIAELQAITQKGKSILNCSEPDTIAEWLFDNRIAHNSLIGLAEPNVTTRNALVKCFARQSKCREKYIEIVQKSTQQFIESLCL